MTRSNALKIFRMAHLDELGVAYTKNWFHLLAKENVCFITRNGLGKGVYTVGRYKDTYDAFIGLIGDNGIGSSNGCSPF